MKRKMYILRTWNYGFGTKLSWYVTDLCGENKNCYTITNERLHAKKFYTKKDAIKYGKCVGECYVDCVWYIQKYYYGQFLDYWE